MIRRLENSKTLKEAMASSNMGTSTVYDIKKEKK
jgi:hypothetical protein